MQFGIFFSEKKVLHENSHRIVVIEKNESTEEATINFLQPKGPARSFTYPDKADILKVPYSDVLSEADVSTRNGRTYNVAKECQERATAILQKRL